MKPWHALPFDTWLLTTWPARLPWQSRLSPSRQPCRASMRKAFDGDGPDQRRVRGGCSRMGAPTAGAGTRGGV